MSRAARRLLVACAALAGAAGAATLVFLLRGDLFRPKRAPAPAPAPVAAPAPEPAKPAPPAAEPPAPPPAPRTLSWENLKVAPFHGDLKSQEPVAKVLDLLDQDLLGAVKDLKDGSGLFPASSNHILFVPISRKDATFREAYAVLPEKGGMRVDLPLEPLVLGWWPPREVLTAALAQAILEEEVPGLAKAPEWLRAGAALELSGFGEAYTRRVLLDFDQPPLLLLRPLADSGDRAWACGYWAVHALTARRGEEALRRWIEAMRVGQGWQEALRSAAGESPEQFEDRYRSWAQAYLREKCVNRQTLLDAVALLRQEKDQQALPLLRDFVEKNPMDLYAGNARYYLNYCRYRLGDYDRAIEGFTSLLVSGPVPTSWQGKAHYFTGRCYQLTGYPPLARGEYQIAALEPDDALLVQVAQKRLKELN